MALAFWVDGRNDGIGKAFAAHDEYLAILSYFCDPKSRRMMTPDDDFFPAPFCFMPKQRSKGGFIVFSGQVPWLHGNPMRNNNNGGDPQQGQGQQDGNISFHARAREWMEQRGKYDAPHIGSVEQFQQILNLKERDVYTFTTSGCYPTKSEISKDLEDRAVRVTCAAMGWDVPENWRIFRKEQLSAHGMPLLDLADWDERKIDNDGDGGGGSSANDDDRTKIPSGDEQCVAQEEKKEYQC